MCDLGNLKFTSLLSLTPCVNHVTFTIYNILAVVSHCGSLMLLLPWSVSIFKYQSQSYEFYVFNIYSMKHPIICYSKSKSSHFMLWLSHWLIWRSYLDLRLIYFSYCNYDYMHNLLWTCFLVNSCMCGHASHFESRASKVVETWCSCFLCHTAIKWVGLQYV